MWTQTTPPQSASLHAISLLSLQTEPNCSTLSHAGTSLKWDRFFVRDFCCDCLLSIRTSWWPAPRRWGTSEQTDCSLCSRPTQDQTNWALHGTIKMRNKQWLLYVTHCHHHHYMHHITMTTTITPSYSISHHHCSYPHCIITSWHHIIITYGRCCTSLWPSRPLVGTGTYNEGQ